MVCASTYSASSASTRSSQLTSPTYPESRRQESLHVRAITGCRAVLDAGGEFAAQVYDLGQFGKQPQITPLPPE